MLRPKRLALAVAVVVVCSRPSLARAEEPRTPALTLTLPRVGRPTPSAAEVLAAVWPALLSLGEAPPLEALSPTEEPLRRGLLADFPPHHRECGTHGEEGERGVALKLHPRLTLFGFSRFGCPLNSVLGGGVTFVQPLARGVSLVLSAGVWVAPSDNTQAGPWTRRAQVRADMVIDRGGGRSFSVGIGTGGVSFGGIF